MKFNPEKHHRRSIRLKNYDYSRQGAYFITIVTKNRECLFGEIINGVMQLNEWGEMVRNGWLDIPNHFYHIRLDEFVIMPNHVHGIIWIVDNNVGARHALPLQKQNTMHPYTIEQFGKPVPGSIPTIIRSLKSAVTKQINQKRQTPGIPVWQRNYYEHIIRNDDELNRIRQYIINNPLNWTKDENYK